ncbi:DUF6456 domain-containing protein [Pseudorhodoplanes sinuspersici]|nr:hypothetical protein DFP91_0409 [Pseudorhodoplanes sinuspersici]
MTVHSTSLKRSALRLLEQLAPGQRPVASAQQADADLLVKNDLATMPSQGCLALTDAGRAFLTRRAHAQQDRGASQVDAFRAQHLSIVSADASARSGLGPKFDESESPLVWLARRKGTDGRPLIEPHQLQAGERLRAEFTAAQMMPRTTSNWHAPIAGRRRDGHAGEHMTDHMVAARQRMRHALDAAGPEFSGLLLDVCCFLKKLDEVERERRWPARSAKVVLQLALERLARHFGYQRDATGKAAAAVRTWAADDFLSEI